MGMRMFAPYPIGGGLSIHVCSDLITARTHFPIRLPLQREHEEARRSKDISLNVTIADT